MKLFLAPIAFSVALLGAVTEQQIVAWMGAFAAGLVIVYPAFQKWANGGLEWRAKWLADRRQDLTDELKRAHAEIKRLKLEIADRDGEIEKWERRFDRGSRDYPQMGATHND